jgi:hypothetical protein
MPNHQHIINTNINASNGYWSVGEEVFFSKIEALIKAHSTKQRINFHFNDHTYNTAKWNLEPHETIQQLYIQRARELRDKYDYLIILYSAGADSTNLLKTFIDNNIKIDHVASFVCKNHHWGDLDLPNIELTKAGSEMIKKIINMGIKFTFENLLDTEIFKKEFKSGEWAYRSGPTLNVGCVMKQLTFFQKKEYLELTKNGKKVCFLWGMEKAWVNLIKGNYYLTFRDQTLQNQSHALRNSPDYPIYHEYFYSGPDATSIKILAKQAHLILNYFEKNLTKQQIERLISWPKKPEEFIGPDPDRELRMLMNNLIYPNTWDNKTFSRTKNSIGWMGPRSLPFLQDKNTTEFKNWQGGMLDVLNNIGPEWKKQFETDTIFGQIIKFQFIRQSCFKNSP